MRGTRRSPSAAERDLQGACATHADELYRFARGLLTDPLLAEAAVEAVFLRAWQAAMRSGAHPASRDPGPWPSGDAERRAWLLATATAVVLQLAWERSVQLPEPVRASDDPAGQILRSWQVQEALRQISADHRRAIVETCHLGRSCADVAAELGIPEEMLRSRVYYGLRALRLALEERGWTGCFPN